MEHPDGDAAGPGPDGVCDEGVGAVGPAATGSPAAPPAGDVPAVDTPPAPRTLRDVETIDRFVAASSSLPCSMPMWPADSRMCISVRTRTEAAASPTS